MIVAVASGKGGTGKTTVATNIALMMSRVGDRKVFYADCDVEAPNGHIFLKPRIDEDWSANVLVPVIDHQTCDRCGKCQEICQYNALAVLDTGVMVFSELCHGCGGCSLVCPLDAVSERPRSVGKVRRGHSQGLGFVSGSLRIGEPMAVPLIRAVKKAIPDDVDVVIDAPPGASCPVVETVEGADFVVLVTEPTPFGLNDLIIAVETMRQLGLPFGVVVNRAGSGDDRVEEYCSRENIPLLAAIPQDRRVAEAYSHGGMICDELPELRKYFDEIIAAIAARDSHRPVETREKGSL